MKNSGEGSAPPSLAEIKAKLGSSGTTLKVRPRKDRKPHKLHLTDHAPNNLISLLSEIINFNDRVVVTVTSNVMMDEVKELVESAGLKSDKEIKIFIHKTDRYMHLKKLGITFEPDEDRPPWPSTNSESQYNLDQREKAKESALFRAQLASGVSTSVFNPDYPDAIQITIMVHAVLFHSLRLIEMEDSDAHVIMFKPGINDFQNDRCVKVANLSAGEVAEFSERPDRFRYPELLACLNVDYVVESNMVIDMIESSYVRYNDGNLILNSTYTRQPSPKTKLVRSWLTSKKRSGTLPIVFNIMNKAFFNNEAVLIGDGISSRYSFNKVRSDIDMIDAPAVVKLSQPPPKMIEGLGKQLGLDFQAMKKAIVIEYAECVLRRIEPEQEVWFICDRGIAKWLGEEIEAFADVEIIPVDDGGRFLRKHIDRDDNPVAYAVYDGYMEVVKLTKSEPALKQWIKDNNVGGKYLEKLMADLMVTATLALREGFDGTQPINNFKFTVNIADRLMVEDRRAAKLVKLIDSSLGRYIKSDDARDSVFERYVESPYL